MIVLRALILQKYNGVAVGGGGIYERKKKKKWRSRPRRATTHNMAGAYIDSQCTHAYNSTHKLQLSSSSMYRRRRGGGGKRRREDRSRTSCCVV